MNLNTYLDKVRSGAIAFDQFHNAVVVEQLALHVAIYSVGDELRNVQL